MDLSPLSGVRYGSFTSNGSSQLLNLGFIPSFYEAWNITQAGNSSANPGVQKRVTWYSPMSAGNAIVMSNTAGAATDQSTLITSGGITAYNGTVPQSFTATAITAISKASAAVVSSTAHGLQIGDSVRIYGSTLMPQVNGLVFTVQSGSFSANAFSIDLNTNTTNFTASTDGFALKVFPASYWQPKRSVIAGITQASPGVVTTAENHLLTTGDIVRINIPASFGMQQLSGQLVEVTVLSATTFSMYVPNTQQLLSGQTPINTSGYTAFAWPAPTSFPTAPAQVIPVGEDTLQTSDPKRNTAFIGLQLGSGVVGSNADVWDYIAILGTQA